MSDPPQSTSSATDRILGPSYDYSAQIRPPSGPGGLGMSADGTFSALESDITGLMDYVKVLLTSEGASKTGKPLGNKFFLETAMKCTDKRTNEQVTRSIYINNIPDGNIKIPGMSNGMSMKFDNFRGLIPGVMSNLSQIDPLKILQSFTTGDNPYCQAITLEVVNVNNVSTLGSGYVTNADINDMPNNWFTDSGFTKPDTSEKLDASANNTTPPPAAGEPGTSGFTTMSAASSLNGSRIDYGRMPNDVLIKIYYGLLGLLGFYFFLKITLRKRLK